MPAASLPALAPESPRIRELLADPRRLHSEVVTALLAEGITTSETSVRRYRASIDWVRAEPEQAGPESATTGASIRADEDATGLTVYHDSWPVQLGEDLSPLVEFFGYDPAYFMVVDDQFKVSKWQTSKGNDDGTRDVIWLYSYKVRFEKIREPINNNDDLDSVLKTIRAFKPIRRTPGANFADPVIYVHQQGDEQIGKGEGGGIAGVTERATSALERSVDRLSVLLKNNPNIAGILDASNGDTIENIFGHYPSQQRTTETLRKQFRGGRDLDIMRTTALAEFGLPIDKAYCTDNHGEMRQSIGLAPFTSESDNLNLILAESVQDILAQSKIADQIEWHIPHDEWWTLVTLLGVNFAIGHGHKAKGNLAQWVKNQRDNLHFHQGFKTHLALLGHKHHFLAHDVAGTTMIQTPSLDGGSPFWEAISGDRSKTGVVTYLAGRQYNQYFSDLVVL